MLPPWDSLAELEEYNAWLKAINSWGPYVFAAFCLCFGLLWYVFTSRVDQHVEKLKSDEEKSRSETIDSGLKLAHEKADLATSLIPKSTGVLVPGRGDTPDVNDETLKKIAESNEGVVLLWGSNVSWATRFPLVLLQQGGERMLYLDGDESGVYLTASFFDREGKRVCKIDRNKFTADNPRLRIVATPNDHRPSKLTVFDDEERRVFEVHFVNERVIQVHGDFYLRHSRRIEMEPGKPSLGYDDCVFGDSDMPIVVPDSPPPATSNMELDRAVQIGGSIANSKPKAGEKLTLRLPVFNTSAAPLRIIAFRSGIVSLPSPMHGGEHALEAAVAKFQTMEVDPAPHAEIAPGESIAIRFTTGRPMTEDDLGGLYRFCIVGSFIYVDGADRKKQIWFTQIFNGTSLRTVEWLGNVKESQVDWQDLQLSQP